jgi:hypothetical protein
MEYLIFLVIALVVAIGGLFLFKKCNILDKP